MRIMGQTVRPHLPHLIIAFPDLSDRSTPSARLLDDLRSGQPHQEDHSCAGLLPRPRVPTRLWQADHRLAGVSRPRQRDHRRPRPSRLIAGRSNRPREAVITDFGTVAALFDLARQLRLTEPINGHVSGAGPSDGTYLLLAAINRCVAPWSKIRIARWFEGTSLRRITDVCPSQLTSQRFWDHKTRGSPLAIEQRFRFLPSPDRWQYTQSGGWRLLLTTSPDDPGSRTGRDQAPVTSCLRICIAPSTESSRTDQASPLSSWRVARLRRLKTCFACSSGPTITPSLCPRVEP